jgi:hypothetical protein
MTENRTNAAHWRRPPGPAHSDSLKIHIYTGYSGPRRSFAVMEGIPCRDAPDRLFLSVGGAGTFYFQPRAQAFAAASIEAEYPVQSGPLHQPGCSTPAPSRAHANRPDPAPRADPLPNLPTNHAANPRHRATNRAPACPMHASSSDTHIHTLPALHEPWSAEGRVPYVAASNGIRGTWRGPQCFMKRPGERVQIAWVVGLVHGSSSRDVMQL